MEVLIRFYRPIRQFWMLITKSTDKLVHLALRIINKWIYDKVHQVLNHYQEVNLQNFVHEVWNLIKKWTYLIRFSRGYTQRHYIYVTLRLLRTRALRYERYVTLRLALAIIASTVYLASALKCVRILSRKLFVITLAREQYKLDCKGTCCEYVVCNFVLFQGFFSTIYKLQSSHLRVFLSVCEGILYASIVLRRYGIAAM